jgi:hypothetical protein
MFDVFLLRHNFGFTWCYLFSSCTLTNMPLSIFNMEDTIVYYVFCKNNVPTIAETTNYPDATSNSTSSENNINTEGMSGNNFKK